MFTQILLSSLSLAAPVPETVTSVAGNGQHVVNGVVISGPGAGTVQNQGSRNVPDARSVFGGNMNDGQSARGASSPDFESIFDEFFNDAQSGGANPPSPASPMPGKNAAGAGSPVPAPAAARGARGATPPANGTAPPANAAARGASGVTSPSAAAARGASFPDFESIAKDKFPDSTPQPIQVQTGRTSSSTSASSKQAVKNDAAAPGPGGKPK